MSGEMKRYDRATAAFSQYAAMDGPELPKDEMSAIQVKLARWRVENFGLNSTNQNSLGTLEEFGEAAEEMVLLLAAGAAAGRMASVILKHEQGIRGLKGREVARAKLADAIVDLLIFTTQLCTEWRLDFGTLYREVGRYIVERRDWHADPENGEKRQYGCHCGRIPSAAMDKPWGCGAGCCYPAELVGA